MNNNGTNDGLIMAFLLIIMAFLMTLTWTDRKEPVKPEQVYLEANSATVSSWATNPANWHTNAEQPSARQAEMERMIAANDLAAPILQRMADDAYRLHQLGYSNISVCTYETVLAQCGKWYGLAPSQGWIDEQNKSEPEGNKLRR